MRKRSRIEKFLLAFLLVGLILSCFVPATVASGNVLMPSMYVKFKDIGRCKAVDFNDSCTVVIKYSWSKRQEVFDGNEYKNVEADGLLFISSDEVNIEKELTDEKFWNDSYEDYSEHEMSLEIRRDMLNEEYGKIEFRLESFTTSADLKKENLVECSAYLYFNVDGDKICLSENEGVVEGYFAKRDLAICAIVMISVIVLFVIVKFIRKIYDKYLWKKHTGEE